MTSQDMGNNRTDNGPVTTGEITFIFFY